MVAAKEDDAFACGHPEGEVNHYVLGGGGRILAWCQLCGATRWRRLGTTLEPGAWRLPRRICSRAHVDDVLREEWERQYQQRICDLEAHLEEQLSANAERAAP